MRAHQERNLWFGEPDFNRRFHRTHQRIKVGCRISRFLVAPRPVRDLLLCAKHLFVAAMVASALPGVRRSTLLFNEKPITQRKSNDATVNPHGGSSDERGIADTQLEPAGTDNTVSWAGH